MENLSKISDYCHLFYHPTYTRISPYLIGILLGYLLHKTKDRGVVQINKVGSFFCLHFKKYFQSTLRNFLFSVCFGYGMGHFDAARIKRTLRIGYVLERR